MCWRGKGGGHVALVSPEGPVEFLLCGPAGGEVDVAVLVRVEGAEDVLTEITGVPLGEESAVDVDEGLSGEFSRGTVRYEACVPFLDGVLVVPCVVLQEEEVLLVEPARSGGSLAHGHHLLLL